MAKTYPSPLSDVIGNIYHGVNIMIEKFNTQDLNFGTLVILAPNSTKTLTTKDIKNLSGLKKLSIIKKGNWQNKHTARYLLHETILNAYHIIKDFRHYKLRIFQTNPTADSSLNLVRLKSVDDVFGSPTLNATEFKNLYYAVELYESWDRVHNRLSYLKNYYDIKRILGINLSSDIINQLNTVTGIIDNWTILAKNEMDECRNKINSLMIDSI